MHRLNPIPLSRLGRLTILTLLAAVLALPAVAHAAPSMSVGVADDGKLFRPGAGALAASWRAAGVDVVRMSVPWDGVAPNARSQTAPRHFRADDPNAPGYRWGFVDDAINTIRSHGMKVDLIIWGPAPYWATQQPSKRNGRLRPVAAQFAAFAAAVAKRYSGRIDAYILWNEPNQSVWLQPQSAAPDLYRDMVNAATPAVHRADRRGKVLIGALASTAHTTRGNGASGPLTFLRRFGCVDGRYRPIHTGACRHFTAPGGDGFALHPHGLRLSPYRSSPNPTEATIGDLKRFESVMDRLTRAHRLRPTGARFPLYLDEMGYQTNPPDPYLGVSWATQAQWLEKASQIAWSDPRVKNLDWWVWRDEKLGAGGGGWQSGVFTLSGRRKPSRAAFSFPFLAARHGRSASVWGQVRPGGRHTVLVQGRGRRGGWRTLMRLRTDAWGGFTRSVRLPSGIVQLRGLAAGGPGSPASKV